MTVVHPRVPLSISTRTAKCKEVRIVIDALIKSTGSNANGCETYHFLPSDEMVCTVKASIMLGEATG